MSCSKVARASASSRLWSVLLVSISLFTLSQQAGADAAADADCLLCHDASFDEPVNSSWHVLHSTRDSGTAAGCTGCHGVSEDHLDNPDDNLPDVAFGGEHASPPETQSAACLGCHQGDQQTWWAGSGHDDADVTCSSCHAVHVPRNATADPVAVSGLCYQCHAPVRSAAKMRSRHPIEEGRTACADCHNPHGSSTEAMLAEPTLNDNCYRCHAEKRGPFLFEHAPVTEDCSHCHQPHGSINDALLTARTPFLCQQCHSAAFHPSLPTTGSGLPGGSANQNLLSRNCLNCHSQVHGSNHPSGGRITR